jgi:hypothetical protein
MPVAAELTEDGRVVHPMLVRAYLGTRRSPPGQQRATEDPQCFYQPHVTSFTDSR